MGQLGKTIASSGRASMWYAEALMKGVEEPSFAVMPTGRDGEINTNHPAFIIGHLAIYPSWLLGAMNLDAGPAAVPETYQELFSAKSTCRSDPERTIYPGRDELINAFNAGYGHFCTVIESLDDEAFAGKHPYDGMRDMFPTIGDLANFMLGAHVMSHLGQLSAWRRCMGLGSAM